MKDMVLGEVVEKKIFLIRGYRVMLDVDLATLYGVQTKRLNEQVKRNVERFPAEFMFRLTKEERGELVANCDRFKMMKHSTSLPSAFTEHGVAMLASVLNSEKAVKVSIVIIKTFVRLREILSSHKELAYKLKELEDKIGKHDGKIRILFEAIKQLTMPPLEPPKRRIGFHQ